MLTRSVKLCLLATTILLTGGAGLAQADPIVVFSNLGSMPQYDPANGWTVDGGADAGQILAAAFTPTDGIVFSDAQLPVGLIFTNLAASPLDVYLAADQGGLPGAAITDLSLAAGQTVGAWPPAGPVTYNCTVCPALNAQTQYWLVVQIPNLNPDDFISEAAWNWNATLDYSSGTNFAYNDSQFGAGWQFGAASELRPAFEIDGIALPEPGPLAMVGVGLGLLAVGRIRRR